MPVPILALAAVSLVAGGALALAYNRLVSLRNRVASSFAQVDAQLRRRYDLIPSLVSTAKGCLAHEKETLEAIVRARGEAVAAEGRAAAAPGDAVAIAALSGAETTLTAGLGRLVGLVERYPDLKGERAMAALLEELRTTENRVAFARQAYNTAVMRYESAREGFPGVLLAGPFGFKPAAYFRIEDRAERAPAKVSL